MTARNLSHYKLKCRDLSREIFLEQGWKLPRGLMNSKERDPRNFTLAEWQQAKRQGLHTRDLKEMMAECWAASDSRKAFEHALSERGMMLAKGDRRGHVAVTHDGSVLSIARYAGKKAKEVHAKLGDPDDLASVDEAKAKLASQMSQAVKRHITEAQTRYKAAMAPLERRRALMVEQQRAERAMLAEKQRARWDAESRERTNRLRAGLSGLWQRLSGERAQLRAQNERDVLAALHRDRDQRQRLFDAQLADRQVLQQDIRGVRQDHAKLLLKLRRDQQHYVQIAQTSKPERANSARPVFQEQAAKPAPAKPQQSVPKPMQDRLERLRNRQTSRPVDRSHEREPER